MIFEHETIRMMRADRVAELEKLKRQLGPESVMIPIRKKSGSFWDQVTIGRGTVNDIVLGDPAVSTLHAHFEVASSGEVSVRDLDSSNGTFVNRTPLQPHKLTVLGAGDCIRFGQTVFYYVTSAMLQDLLK